MIDFQKVCKSYSEQVLLDEVSFRINSSDRVGIVGPNGAGKTTIFKIIAGIISQDKGEVNIPKNFRIGYLKQQLPDDSDNVTLLDFAAGANGDLERIEKNIVEIEQQLHEQKQNLSNDEIEALLKQLGHLQSQYEHLGAYRIRSEAEQALCGLGFSTERLQQPIGSFSGGWQMRGALAQILISDPDILLLDEPSNYLDVPAVEWLCKFLRNFDGTLLLISHDRFLLNKLTNITLEVNGGAVVRYNGNYDYYRAERENRSRCQESAKRNMDRRKEQMQRTIDRFRAKSTKAAQAQSLQKKLDKLDDVQLMSDLNFMGSIRFPKPPPFGAEAARYEHVTFGYDGKNNIVEDVSLQIDSGEKLAFIGYNGTGKTTLLKLLTGKLTPQQGTVTLGHNIIPGYQAQEFADVLDPEQSVYDVVRAAMGRDFNLNSLPNLLGSFGFSQEAMNKPTKVLSGGEKIRLCFARIFVNPPNLLILDEPTTHLDIASREALQEALREFSGTVCLVSHDIEFVRNVANTIIAMTPPGITKYFGNYDYYLEKSAALGLGNIENSGKNIQNNTAGKNNSNSNSPAVNFDSKEKRRERAAQRQELAGAKKKAEKLVATSEAGIEQNETRKAEIINELATNNKADFASLNKELSDINLKLEELTRIWEEAATELEEIMRKNAAIHDN